VNTPAHAVVSLVLLGTGRDRVHAAPVLAGALTPDLPMFLFYLWERLVRGSAELQIWSEAYFRPAWQDFFDVFNSIPFALLGLGIALARRSRGTALFFSSVVLHCAFDLPLHREDAHRHFFPFSDWRFVSPVSYWDPAHHGALAALAEAVVVLAGSALLWSRHRGLAPRVALVAVNLLYLGVYAGFYWLGGA
jgi:hypothetical protein